MKKEEANILVSYTKNILLIVCEREQNFSSKSANFEGQGTYW